MFMKKTRCERLLYIHYLIVILYESYRFTISEGRKYFNPLAGMKL
jgi:hypothetical protein